MVSLTKYLRGPALTAAVLAGGGCSIYKPLPAPIALTALADTHQQARYDAARIRLDSAITHAAEELSVLDKSLEKEELLALLFGKKADVVILPPTKTTPAKIACSVEGFENIRRLPHVAVLLEALEAMQEFKADTQFNITDIAQQTASQLMDQYLVTSGRLLLSPQVENCKLWITLGLKNYLENKEAFVLKTPESATQVAAREKAFSDMMEKHKDSVNAWTYGRDTTHKHCFAFQSASNAVDPETITRRYIDIDLPGLEFITTYRASDKAGKLSSEMRQFLDNVIHTEARVIDAAKRDGLTPESHAAKLLLPSSLAGCLLNPFLPENQTRMDLLRNDADIRKTFPARPPSVQPLPQSSAPRAYGR